MSTSISMPQLGESVAEGTIGKWLKSPGERIERDEPLVEVITDKVNAEIPSPVAGVIERIVVPEGQTVAVGTELVVIGDGVGAGEPSATRAPAAAPAELPAGQLTGGEAAGDPVKPDPRDAAATGQERVPQGPTGAAQNASPAAIQDEPPAPGSSVGGYGATARPDGQGATTAATTVPRDGDAVTPTRASPLVRRLAREHAVDLSQIAGSGVGGRVTKDDILGYIESREAAPSAPAPQRVGAPSDTPVAPPRPDAPAAPVTAASSRGLGEDEELVPLTPMRRVIAEHMVRSLQTSPHAWGMVEVDVTPLVAARESLVKEWKAREGFELTYLPFFVKAVVEALRECPVLNARWSDQGVVLKRRVHIGVAVAVQDGLIVPVIKDADQKSIGGLALAARDLVTRARNGRLAMDDLQGGTFTVNNTGALGSIASGPIINQPQAGIITMEAIVKRPMVRDDAIAIRSMMNACLAFDHRVTDGAEALRFLQIVKRRVEAYGPGTAIY